MENYYINKCSSENEIGHNVTKYGYSKTYLVDDKEVTLHFNQYANGADDYDDELVQVEVKPIKSLLDNLKTHLEDLKNPLGMLGKSNG